MIKNQEIMALTESHQKIISKIVEIIKNTIKDDLVSSKGLKSA